MHAPSKLSRRLDRLLRESHAADLTCVLYAAFAFTAMADDFLAVNAEINRRWPTQACTCHPCARECCGLFFFGALLSLIAYSRVYLFIMPCAHPQACSPARTSFGALENSVPHGARVAIDCIVATGLVPGSGDSHGSGATTASARL